MAAADSGSVCAGTYVSSFLASEICWDKCLSKISKDTMYIANNYKLFWNWELSSLILCCIIYRGKIIFAHINNNYHFSLCSKEKT